VRIVAAAGMIVLLADACGTLSFASGLLLRLLLLCLFPFALVLSGGVSAAELRKLPALLRALGKRSS
jgi:hypothetical protein